MKSFALDGTNDISLDSNSGSFEMDTERQELQQKIINAVSTNQNELSWNSSIGLDQLDLIYNANDPSYINSILTQYLKTIFGKEVVSVTIHNPVFNDKTRTLSFSSDITLNVQGELLKLQPAFNLGGE